MMIQLRNDVSSCTRGRAPEGAFSSHRFWIVATTIFLAACNCFFQPFSESEPRALQLAAAGATMVKSKKNSTSYLTASSDTVTPSSSPSASTSSQDDYYQEDYWWQPNKTEPILYRYPHKVFAALSESADPPHEAAVIVAVQQDKTKATRLPKRKALVVAGCLAAPLKREPRDYIRNTWAYGRQNVFFLVGGEWTPEIAAEFEQEQDLIWIDVKESYRGITAKVLAFYAVVDKHIPNLEYALKADDDSYVRMHFFEHGIEQDMVTSKEFQSTGHFFAGACQGPRPKRNPNHRWYVSWEQFPYEKYFAYGAGSGYVLSKKTLHAVTRQHYLTSGPPADDTEENAAQRGQAVPNMLPIEDAQTGWMVHMVGGKCTHLEAFRTDFEENHEFIFYHYYVEHKVVSESSMRQRHRNTCCEMRKYHNATPTAHLVFDPVSCHRFMEEVCRVKPDGSDD
mmetsp:Transcript_3478/g.6634  ORF Transcript_3478/g.6634 Transcript_3478/m.6634 type:complete len:452 (+) Transcript_3478:137-1492(+)